MNNNTKKWLRGGLETLIHGVTAAVTSTIAAATIDGHDWALGSHNFWELAAASFAANGGVRFLQWWGQNPLPPDDDQAVSLNPLSSTIKTPESPKTP